MQVRVLFFGMLKDVTGRASEQLELPSGSTMNDLLEHYRGQWPRFSQVLPALATSVNQQYAPRTTVLQEQDEVGLLPPVSGGTPAADAGRAAIVREPINTQRLLESIKRPEDGAAVVFEGIVRNNSRGRPTLYLDYEAYEGMALKQLEALMAEALHNFPVRDGVIVHRLGRLEIGETSVLIVVASAHRAAAFEACHWIIDMLKKKVPIWKKEYFADGAVWADGEPFPPEIAGDSPK